MFCKNCGKENEEGNTFCAFCGSAITAPAMSMPPEALAKPPQAPKPPKPPKQKTGKTNVMAWAMSAVAVVLAVLLVLSLVGVLGGSGGTGGSSGGGSVVAASKSFGTPEEAIEYFVDCMKAGDIDGAMQACAAGEQAANFDYETLVNRLGVVSPIYMSGMPAEYDEYRLFNEIYFANQITRQVLSFYIGFTLPEKYEAILNGREYLDLDGDIGKEALAALEPPDLTDLEIVEIAKHNMVDGDLSRENAKRLSKTYGADDYTTRSVLYELDGDYYMGGFGLFKYNGRWLIYSLSDPLSGTSPMGNAVLLDDKDDFDDIME